MDTYKRINERKSLSDLARLYDECYSKRFSENLEYVIRFLREDPNLFGALVEHSKLLPTMGVGMETVMWTN